MYVILWLSLFFFFFHILPKIKGTFLAAIGIFEIGSLVCALAPSSTVLIIGRAIAGIGVGGLFSGALVIIAHTSQSHTLSFHAIIHPYQCLFKSGPSSLGYWAACLALLRLLVLYSGAYSQIISHGGGVFTSSKHLFDINYLALISFQSACWCLFGRRYCLRSQTPA